MYVAMGEGSGLVKGGNLTAKLMSTTAGKRVFGYLMAGTEGYAYGKATRKQEDKGQAGKMPWDLRYFTACLMLLGWEQRNSVTLFKV